MDARARIRFRALVYIVIASPPHGARFFCGRFGTRAGALVAKSSNEPADQTGKRTVFAQWLADLLTFAHVRSLHLHPM